ncbi:MAG: hypothetical protein AB7F64_02410 [Gammaproteobacteria bacterium]
MSKAPKVIKTVEFLPINSNQDFSIPLAEFFEPQDESLSFHFSSGHPEWLRIDRETGHLHGHAPHTKSDQIFEIFIKVSNYLGVIHQSFTIKLLCIDTAEEDETKLVNILSKRKEKYISHLYTYIPDLLEYVLTFYQVPELIEKLYFSLVPLAEDLNLPLDKDVPYEQFKDIVTKLNPDIEDQLRSIADESLTKEKLDHEQLQNLFRQGSQQTGVITIPTWNYQGGVVQYNWSHFKTILESAAVRVAQLHVYEEQNIQRNSPVMPQLKPKGHPGG